MSLDMMPHVLRNMLIALMSDSTITSWNIRGEGKQNQLTIRFSSDNMADTETISYRKAPPSQTLRNKNRQQEWKERIECDEIKDPSANNDELVIAKIKKCLCLQIKTREPAIKILHMISILTLILILNRAILLHSSLAVANWPPLTEAMDNSGQAATTPKHVTHPHGFQAKSNHVNTTGLLTKKADDLE